MESLRSLVILGAGGFGRETLDLVSQIDPRREIWKVVGFVSQDEDNPKVLDLPGVKWIRSDDQFLLQPFATHFTAAVGTPDTRLRLVNRYEACGLKPVTLVHPTVLIGSSSSVGLGSIVCSHVSVTTNVVIGLYAHIDRSVTIGHDSIIEDFVTLHPSSVISGGAHIATRAIVGANACVLPGIIVGQGAVIGAGAVVNKNVPAYATVAGVPARRLDS